MLRGKFETWSNTIQHKHKHISISIGARITNIFVFLVSACAYAYGYVAFFTSENGANISITGNSSHSTDHKSLWPRLLRKVWQAKLGNAITSVGELLAESVRLYAVLYNKGDKFFKDVNTKTLAWEDVAKKLVFPQVISRHVCLLCCCFIRRKQRKYGLVHFCPLVPAQIEVLNQDHRVE